MLNTHRFMLDMNEQTSMVYVTVRKGDTGQRISAALRSGESPFDLSDVATAVLAATIPAGTHINTNGTVDDEKGVVEVAIPATLTAAVGAVECNFVLTGSSGGLLKTPPFRIIVQDAPDAS